jgi:tryptophan-rich sensory protein
MSAFPPNRDDQDRSLVMNQFAPSSQSRTSLARLALFVIPTIMFLGFLSGTMSGSTADNAW